MRLPPKLLTHLQKKKAINQQITFTTIRAPFDGTVDRIPFKEGSLVENGSLLTTVSQLDDVYAYFSIPENTYFQMMEDKTLNTQGDIKLVLPPSDGEEFLAEPLQQHLNQMWAGPVSLDWPFYQKPSKANTVKTEE